MNTLSREAKASGSAIFVMADGSRGPARIARWGAIHLARSTGFPIVPVRAWGDNLVTLEKTWMKLVLPKPWGRETWYTGVEARGVDLTKPDALEAAMKTFERTLDEVENLLAN